MASSDATQGSAASVDTQVLPSDQGARYRIALRHPDKDHANSAWFSWRRMFRYDPDVHPDDFDPLKAAKGSLGEAKREFPGHEARVEALVDNGDDTHSWVEVS